MKKATAILLIFAALVCMSACAKKNQIDIGKETTSVAVKNGNKSEAAHLTDEGYMNKMDHFDKDGKLVYTEEYIYDKNGDVSDYVYKDKDGKTIASYRLSDGQFFNKTGGKITEDEFLEKMRSIGADL